MRQDAAIPNKAVRTNVTFDLPGSLLRLIAQVWHGPSKTHDLFPGLACACDTCACMNAHRSCHQVP